MTPFRAVYLLLALLVSNILHSQNVSDCENAIILCGEIYSSEFSPTGTGAVYEYTGVCNQNLEIASTWYTFTVSEAGILNFAITPNDLEDDYDWALFDITTGGCAGIGVNGLSSEVSCNSYGSFLLPNGATGISSTLGGISNTGGPGDTNGPPFNADLNVAVGNEYALVVMNWSNSSIGYTISFAGSTAQVYDDVPPVTATATTNCDNTKILIEFSEPIVINSVQLEDFQVTGENGLVGLTNVIPVEDGVASESFEISLAEQISPGEYSFLITDANGYIWDTCGNVNFPGIDFTIPDAINFEPNITPACDGSNGSISIENIEGGLGPYTLLFGTNILTDSIIENLTPGNYQISIIDSRLCIMSEFVTVNETEIEVIIPQQDSLDCLNTAIQISGIEIQPAGSYSYNWEYFDGNNFVNTTDSILNPNFQESGLYQLTVQNTLNGCTGTAQVEIFNSTLPTDTLAPVVVSAQLDCINSILTIALSEPVIAATISLDDFDFLGGNIQPVVYDATLLDSLNGLVTAISISFVEPLEANTIYTLHFIQTNVPISDACGNAIIEPLEFFAPAPAFLNYNVTAACSENTGSIEITEVVGEGLLSVYINDQLITSNIIDSLDAGQYEIMVMDTFNCASNTSITVPDGSFTISTQEQASISCMQPVVTIEGIVPVPDQEVDYTWYFVSSSGTEMLNTTSANPTFDQPGDYLVVLTNPETGCVASNSFEITTEQPWNDITAPTILILTVEPCNTGNMVLLLSEPVITSTVDINDFIVIGNEGEITITSISPVLPGSTYNDSFIIELDASQITGGTFSFVSAITGNPITDACGNILNDEFEITFQDNLSINASATTACNGLGGSVVFSEPSGGTAPYLLTFDDAIQNDNEVSNLASGLYSVELQDLNGCKFEFEVEVPNQEISINVPQQDSLSCEEPYVVITGLEVSPEQTVNYTWSQEIDGEFMSTNLNGASPQISESGTYLVSAANTENGCNASTTIVIVNVNENDYDLRGMQYPNIFTPNKDSKNESWAPFIAEEPNLDITRLFDEYKLKIYNRWGQLVFDSEQSNARRWTVNEEMEGTYFYTLSFKKTCGIPFSGDHSGNIQLLK
jgi:gliding motility-associated-like protein